MSATARRWIRRNEDLIYDANDITVSIHRDREGWNLVRAGVICGTFADSGEAKRAA